MSMMGKLNYFLGLQIKKSNNGIFINQSSYFQELLKKLDNDNCKEIDTLMGLSTYVDQDESDTPVGITKYRGVIDLVLYLTTSWPDIMFSVCLCAWYQENPK